MRLALRYLFLTGIAFCVSSLSRPLFSQDRCATVEYSENLHPDFELRKTQFEQWVKEKRRLRVTNRSARQRAQPYRIPVVVHIIHNGEAIGTGANISDAQVLSQIRVLNEDFNRLNADTVNTPAIFRSVAGNLDIEFVLARRDPDGLSTTGIQRVNGNRDSWTMNDNYTLKALSYWPAEEYLNIWVCRLSASHVGFAQFPESDLPGMEGSSTNRLTDGVVLHHTVVGSEDDGPFNLDAVFNKGRTGTHEVGHFFGLNHIWGKEASCNDTDYVDDTPNQYTQTSGCPTHPRMDNCSAATMFQNYLDYTNDACMNLFTDGQVERMTIVLENSPRRNSLLSSPGLQEPDPLPNDIGIRAILFPDISVCSNEIVPVIEVHNYGSNLITSTRIRFVLNGTIVETRDFPLSLNPQEGAQLSFALLNIPSGSHDIAFQVLSTNGGTDSGSYNDLRTSTVVVPFFASTPLTENFSEPPAGWITRNPDGQITWQIVTAPNENPDNKALKLNAYDYEDKIGEIDVFLSPVVDLSAAPAAALSFKVAYARYMQSNERLQVVVITDCQDRTEGTIIYNKAGDALKTSPATTNAFTPSGENQWRQELLDVSAFIGAARVQFAFVGINDWGNNLYIDNISLFTDERSDLELVRLKKPALVTCADRFSPEILIRNIGSVVVNDLVVDMQVNDGPVLSTTITGLSLAFGGEQVLTLPEAYFSEASNTLTVNIRDPNGQPDADLSNNAGNFMIVVNNERDRIPLRQNFEQDFSPAWTVVAPHGSTAWDLIPTNSGRSLYVNTFSNGQPDEEAWLVSPVLDFSGTTEASMLFDLSYGMRGKAIDTLTMLASTDCGITYFPIRYPAQSGFASQGDWHPQTEEEWHRNVVVNLNALAGFEEVRIAFVVRNQQGNNVFLDNIEFFVTADPDPVEIGTPYSVYGYDLSSPGLSELRITFNLATRQHVRYSVIDITGRLESDGVISDVLNQTFPLPLEERLMPGVYFIRVQIDGRFYSTKILVH